MMTLRAKSLRPARASAAVANAIKSAAKVRWSREWIYFSVTLLAWSFIPLIRRLIDFAHGAFNPIALTSLVPFLMVLPLGYVCFRKERWARLNPFFKTLVYIWTATLGYGFVVAAAFGSPGAALFELVQYLVPMLAGIWFAGQGLPLPQAFRRLGLVLLTCAAVVAVYGIGQWVNPPAWDVLWVEGAGFLSADNPVPFGMRVFSTLNSPEPAADFFVIMILLLFPFLRLRNVWTWPLLCALGASLLLTLVREAWVGMVVGTAVFLLMSPRRLTTLPFLGIFAALLIAIVSTLPSMLGSGANADFISDRVATLGDVDHDASALERQREISDSLTAGLANPIGGGLGNIGAAARLGSNAQGTLGSNLDSGYLARFLELGWAGIVAYLFVVLAGPAVLAYRVLVRPRGDPLDIDVKVICAAALAVCAYLAWGDAANDAHFGLDGLLFWLALSMCSLALGPAEPAGVARDRFAVRKGLARTS